MAQKIESKLNSANMTINTTRSKGLDCSRVLTPDLLFGISRFG